MSDSDKDAVRLLSNDAVSDFNSGRFDVAREKFIRAYEVARVPRLAVWIARASVHTKQLVSAHEYYRQAIRLEHSDLWIGTVQADAQRDAEAELVTLVPRIPKLAIAIRAAAVGEVEVRVDDVVVPAALVGVERLIDPGQHEVTGIWHGKVARQAITAEEGTKASVELRFDGENSNLQPPTQLAILPTVASSAIEPTKAGSSQRTWGWVAVGVGTVGALTGIGAGAVVAVQHSSLNRDCPAGVCQFADQSRVDNYRTMRLVSSVGFIVGGVGAATGVTLLLLTPSQNRTSGRNPSLGLWASPGLVGATGTF